METVKKPLLIEYFRFLIRPTYNSESSSFKLKLWSIVKLISWSYLTIIPIGIVIILIFQLLKYEGTNAVDQFASNSSIPTILILAVIIGPFLEELTFRLSLRFKPIFLGISVAAMTFYVLDSVVSLEFVSFSKFIITYITIPLLVGGIVFLISSIPIIRSVISRLYEKHFPLVFYFFSIVFAFIHIFNYSEIKSILFVAPIIILPQVIAGLALGFVRVKYGFWYGVLTHSSYNFFLSSPLLLLSDQTPIRLIIGGAVGSLLLTLLAIGFITFIIDIVKEFQSRTKK